MYYRARGKKTESYCPVDFTFTRSLLAIKRGMFRVGGSCNFPILCAHFICKRISPTNDCQALPFNCVVTYEDLLISMHNLQYPIQEIRFILNNDTRAHLISMQDLSRLSL